MLTWIVTIAAVIAADPPAGHDANPLFRELRNAGLAIGADVRAKFPAPVLPDGLDAAGQKQAITAFIKGDYRWEEFTRKSQVAPQLLRIANVTPADPKAPARQIDVGFVVYGDFQATEDEKFLDRLLNAGREGGGGKPMTADDLTKRKIEPGSNEKIGHVEFDFLDRVRLTVTGQAVWSRTPESVLAAARIDPRFTGDAGFPNEWRPLTKERGEQKVGPPKPYDGAGFYLKITKLAEPAGALFVEQHVIYAEPTGWFDGQPLLRSKLAPVVQNNVRTMRREWAKK